MNCRRQSNHGIAFLLLWPAAGAYSRAAPDSKDIVTQILGNEKAFCDETHGEKRRCGAGVQPLRLRCQMAYRPSEIKVSQY